jgi:hypothetical protein
VFVNRDERACAHSLESALSGVEGLDLSKVEGLAMHVRSDSVTRDLQERFAFARRHLKFPRAAAM